MNYLIPSVSRGICNLHTHSSRISWTLWGVDEDIINLFPTLRTASKFAVDKVIPKTLMGLRITFLNTDCSCVFMCMSQKTKQNKKPTKKNLLWSAESVFETMLLRAALDLWNEKTLKRFNTSLDSEASFCCGPYKYPLLPNPSLRLARGTSPE